MTRRVFSLLLALLLPGVAYAQVCPVGSTCSPLETYIYGQAAAAAPYGSGLHILAVPNGSASSSQYIPGNVLATLADTQTLTNKTLTGPVMTAPVLGTPTSGLATNLTGLPLTTGVTGLLSVANGGTGTATPSLVAGSNVTVTGSWPNQTIASTGGGGGGAITVTGGGNTETAVTTLALGSGFSVPGGSSGTAAVSAITTYNNQSGASYTIVSGDGNKIVHMTNASATAVTLPASATVGATWGATLICDAGCTVTRAGSDTVNAATSVTLAAAQWAALATNGSGAFYAGLSAGAGSGAVTIASGTAALGTGAITSATCATAVTATATGTAATDVLTASFNGDPTAVTGYIPATAGMLTIISYPTTNTANFKVCNNTSSSVTPGAITLNWRVVR